MSEPGAADIGQGRMDDVSPQKMHQVIAASAAGTVFEWYDFFIFAILTSIISKHFYAGLPDAQAFVFTLLTFAVGFIVRPLGALVFGKMGDTKGRKGTFLVTITLMGISTVAIGLLPNFAWFEANVGAGAGLIAPCLLILCRVAQGFALGGEYGGAAIYVAEHAPAEKRGYHTGWIQTSAALGLLGALGVVLFTRSMMGEEAFRDWGWRIPFLVSIGLLALSLWIRLSLEESPAFQKMKNEGKEARAIYSESFFEWGNLKIVLISLFTIMMAQGVVWYTGNFYTQFFLERLLKLPSIDVNYLMLVVTFVSAFLYVFFGWLSDKLGRKPVMLFGMILMLAMYFPGFKLLTEAANPQLARAQVAAPVTVAAPLGACSFQLDLTGGAQQFGRACDIAKGVLANNGVNYSNAVSPAGSPVVVMVGDVAVTPPEAGGLAPSEVKAKRAAFEKELKAVLGAKGYPSAAVDQAVNWPLLVAVMLVFIIGCTALYGPLAAAMVELFPTRIRYTAMSVPYHVGTGWFGGLQPAISFAIVTASGDIYAGLWFPAIVTAIAVICTLLLLPETRTRDIHE
jgi:MFS family permease